MLSRRKTQAFNDVLYAISENSENNYELQKLEHRQQQLTKTLMIEERVYKRYLKIVTRVEKDKMKASIMRLRRELSAVQKLIQARKKTSTSLLGWIRKSFT